MNCNFFNYCAVIVFLQLFQKSNLSSGTFVIPEIPCPFKCLVLQPEPQCGTDGNDYENTCYRECAEVDLLLMGKCPRECKCKKVYKQNCFAPGSADVNCNIWCESEKSKFHVNCTGNKFTNGPCICPKNSEYSEGCGANGVKYANSCLRECEAIAGMHKRFCEPCDCYLLWDTTECGLELHFEKDFSPECIKKCRKERKRILAFDLLLCHVNRKTMTRCESKSDLCGHDLNVYPGACAMKCALGEDARFVQRSWCPKCDCLASLWSKDCGATDYLPIEPDCHNECPEVKLRVESKKQRVICSTKTSKACVCPASTKKRFCGEDGQTYDSECHRMCEDGAPLAYWGNCADSRCNCRQVWTAECSGKEAVDPFCSWECEKPKSVNNVTCRPYFENKVCVCNSDQYPKCMVDGISFQNKC